MPATMFSAGRDTRMNKQDVKETMITFSTLTNLQDILESILIKESLKFQNTRPNGSGLIRTKLVSQAM